MPVIDFVAFLSVCHWLLLKGCVLCHSGSRISDIWRGTCAREGGDWKGKRGSQILDKRGVCPACSNMLIYFPAFSFRVSINSEGQEKQVTLKKRWGKNNDGFFWHQKQYISYILHCAQSPPFFSFHYLSVCFFIFYLFIHLKPYGNNSVAQHSPWTPYAILF